MLKAISLTTLGLSSLLWVSNTFATTGGPQEIELLGYEKTSAKLYLLRHYQDGRGRIPQLYYYQLNSKTPDKLIEVKSLYINPTTKQIDYDQEHTEFNQALEKIKSRLTPLIANRANNTKIQILSHKTEIVPSSYVLDEKMPKYLTQYQISSQHHRSAKHQAVSYDLKYQGSENPKDPKLKIRISQNFMIPNQNKMIVVVQYFGIPWESGYDIEDPVLLLPKK